MTYEFIISSPAVGTLTNPNTLQNLCNNNQTRVDGTSSGGCREVDRNTNDRGRIKIPPSYIHISVKCLQATYKTTYELLAEYGEKTTTSGGQHHWRALVLYRDLRSVTNYT